MADTDSRFTAAVLHQEDLVRFNRWLWLTRLRSVAAMLAVVALIEWIEPPALRPTAVIIVCVAALLPSALYRLWLRTRRHLRLLAYTQLTVDMAALLVGLFFVQRSPVLFHFLLLLVVVPASMIEWQCGLFFATLGSCGHFLLLSLRGGGPWLSVSGLAPPIAFFIIAMQSLFYARHLAQKNTELAEAAASLKESNLRWEEEATVSGALLGAAETLTTSLDPQEILDRLNDIARRVLGCDWSVTLLWDPQREVYRVAAAAGGEPELVEELRSFEFAADSAPLFAAAVERGVLAVENRDSPMFPGSLMQRWRVSSFLCANLQRAGASVGLLTAGFNQRIGPFSARETRLFRSVAHQAAIALDNARLVESLRSASRLKSEFIGTMSHELRSPLNVVIGYVDLLLDGDMGPLVGEQREALERVRQHALQLLELIQETLDVNRLEAGLLPLDLETFTVGEFIDDVQDSIPANWLKASVALRFQVDSAAALPLRSDRAKLKKVLRNLIHNALKFTDSGQVNVQVSAADGWIDFVVSDTGIGISPEALPVIFEMFRQVDGSTTRRYGGVGLGLYIVKQLVRGLGGDISVTSTVGSGSTFRVRLRRADQLPLRGGAAAASGP